jgi:hypothetical protein
MSKKKEKIPQGNIDTVQIYRDIAGGTFTRKRGKKKKKVGKDLKIEWTGRQGTSRDNF